MLTQIQGILYTVTWLDLLDILILAIVLYKFYYAIKDTRAVSLLKGLIVLLIATLASKWLGLNVINWVLQKSMTVLMIALPVVFQPELRRALEQLGRGRFFRKSVIMNEEEAQKLLGEVTRAITSLSQNKIGALLIFEREIGLNDYIDTGIKIDGLVTSEFLTNVFIPNTPMHDGAVIIRGNRVMAAGCLLPLTEDRTLNKELGTRHRAAIGISEQTDSVVVVVSEETGTISYAHSGRLIRYLDGESLKNKLRPFLVSKQLSLNEIFAWRQS